MQLWRYALPVLLFVSVAVPLVQFHNVFLLGGERERSQLWGDYIYTLSYERRAGQPDYVSLRLSWGKMQKERTQDGKTCETFFESQYRTEA